MDKGIKKPHPRLHTSLSESVHQLEDGSQVAGWTGAEIERQKHTPAQQNPRANQADGALLRCCVWAIVFLLQVLRSHDTWNQLPSAGSDLVSGSIADYL